MEFFIPLLFFIIWFLGWIFNLNEQNNQKGGQPQKRGQQPRQPRPEGREKLQTEIDAFLNEIGANREKKGDGVEIVRHDRIRQEKQEERRRREQERRREQQRRQESQRQQRQQQSRRPKPSERRPPAKSDRSASTSERQRPGDNVANREAPGKKDLGSGVASHVDQYMNSHIAQYMAARKSGLSKDQAARALSKELSNEQVADAEKRLSEQNFQEVSPAEMQAGDFHPANIIKLMQNPSTVRTAIIMNEILQRPKSLQQ